MSLIERLEKYCLTPAMSGFEDEDLEPPRARLFVTTSPSRVTTVTDG